MSTKHSGISWSKEHFDPQPNTINIHILQTFAYYKHSHKYKLHDKCCCPGYKALPYNHSDSCFASELSLYGCDCCHAWCVKETENQQRGRLSCGKQPRYSACKQHLKCRNYTFLCHKSAYKRCDYTPVSEAERFKYRNQKA